MGKAGPLLMNTPSLTAFVLVLVWSLLPASAQVPPRSSAEGGFGPAAPVSPKFSATFSKLCGDHKAFSAGAVVQMNQTAGSESLTTPCKVAYLDRKLRMEIDLTQSKGSQLPAGMTAQLKAMGMGEMAILSHEAKGVSYLVYPGLQSYAEVPSADGKPIDDSKTKISVTELSKETINGHPCVKNKVMVTDESGRSDEATVWNATDLKKFPVRIEMTDKNGKVTMNLTNVNFDKPDAKNFEPPANFTRYTDVQTMMREGMMKRMLGGSKPGP